jgi:hypothetical protein
MFSSCLLLKKEIQQKKLKEGKNLNIWRIYIMPNIYMHVKTREVSFGLTIIFLSERKLFTLKNTNYDNCQIYDVFFVVVFDASPPPHLPI